MAGGVELDAAERTSDATATSTTLADVSGLSVTVPVGARPVEITVTAANMSNNAATGGVKVHVVEDSTDLGAVATCIFSAASQAVPCFGSVRRAPSAGNHTYKVQLGTITAGTATLVGNTGGAANACASRIQVNEI